MSSNKLTTARYLLKQVQTKRLRLLSLANYHYLTSDQLAEIKKDSLVEALTSLKNKEVEVGKMLQDKYGNGTINLESGIFTKTE